MSRTDEGTQSKRNKALEAKCGSKNLPGGGTQFYIPNLKVGHIELGNVSFTPL